MVRYGYHLCSVSGASLSCLVGPMHSFCRPSFSGDTRFRTFFFFDWKFQTKQIVESVICWLISRLSVISPPANYTSAVPVNLLYVWSFPLGLLVVSGKVMRFKLRHKDFEGARTPTGPQDNFTSKSQSFRPYLGLYDLKIVEGPPRLTTTTRR